MNLLCVKAFIAMNGLKNKLVKEEAGMGMVEIALIIVIIITLGLTFKTRINDFLKDIFDSWNFDSLKTA